MPQIQQQWNTITWNHDQYKPINKQISHNIKSKGKRQILHAEKKVKFIPVYSNKTNKLTQKICFTQAAQMILVRAKVRPRSGLYPQ